MNVTSCMLKTTAGSLEGVPRDGFPQIAFMGRSNVGKSSLINRLLGRKGLARTSKTPGRTRTLQFYVVNGRFYFVDLPGYGYARVPRPMREEWRGLIESYLEGRHRPDLAIVLVDARHPATGLDRELLEWLRAAALEHQVVLTKADKLSRGQRGAAAAAAAADLSLMEGQTVVAVSAVTGDGMPALWKLIDQACVSRRPHERTTGSETLTTPATPAR